MKPIDKLLAGLNQNQKEAVIDTEGPSLIVAGAGSGKTKVLTTKLAYIISEKKAWSNQILCVTFTNKAAKNPKIVTHGTISTAYNITFSNAMYA